MKYSMAIVLLVSSMMTAAQNLKSFQVIVNPDSAAYVSIHLQKAYSRTGAVVVKESVDIGLFKTMQDKTAIIEWYNLKPDNEKAPQELWGTKTKIAAISFDREQFDKCKTVADLKKMTGYLTTNSLSHFAVVHNTGEYYQRCFIIEKENGKRGLLFVTPNSNNDFKVEVKSE